ncbi:hypothetical protein EG68_02877 [Paragonimus skrjabini miyazakii]|uniref:Centrosomal protein of 162 kDa n=1 Tax=Paragonimus skrjabini miyazakii TaxID=59628 RepID=A0A8S9YWY2_9TREM|nr:hypothetical protein EG68_02877 [Paragonimus skrjabini miyazakii]
MKVTEDEFSVHENGYLKKVRLFDSVDDTTSENTLTTHESTIPRNVKGIRPRGVLQKPHQNKGPYSRRETLVSSISKQASPRVIKSVPPRAPGVVKPNRTQKTSAKVRNKRTVDVSARESTEASVMHVIRQETCSTSSSSSGDRSLSDLRAVNDHRPSMFASLVSRLEQELAEEKSRTVQLQAELTEQQNTREQQLSEVRSAYDAELLHLQNVITRLQTTRSPTDRVTRLTGAHKCPPDSAGPEEKSSDQCFVDANENVERLRKELVQQDRLIAGFQRENERLCLEIRKIKESGTGNKEAVETSERLARENASLRMELNHLQEEGRLRAKRLGELLVENQNRDKEHDLAELKQRLSDSQAELENVKLDRDTARAEVFDLTNNLDHMRRSYQQLAQTLEVERAEHVIARDGLVDEHAQVVRELKRKMQWYVENQAILNRDAAKLQNQAKQIEKLTKELTLAKQQTCSPLENAPRSSHMPSTTQQNGSSENMDRILLEQRIRALQEELELTRENGKKAIRSLQQQYEAVKFHYEERIQALQLLVKHYQVIDRAPDDKTEDQPNSKKLNRPALTLGPDDSQRVQHLLLKLHSQIHHLKQELTNRQRSIEQVEHFTRLNSSTAVGHPHRNSRTRASRIAKKAVSPKMIETPLKVINHLPSGKHDTTEPGNRMPGQATQSMSCPTNKDVAILTKLDELVEEKREISTTDDAQLLEAELERQAGLVIRLQNELSDLRASQPKESGPPGITIKVERVHAYFVQSFGLLLTQLDRLRKRVTLLEYQLRMLTELHRAVVKGHPSDRILAQLFEQLCALERDVETKIVNIKSHENTQKAHVVQPCPCQHLLSVCLEQTNHWQALAEQRKTDLDRLSADADVLVSILTQLKCGRAEAA